MKLINSRFKLLNQLVNNRIIQHLCYWLTYILFFGIIWGTYDMDFIKTFSVELISLPIKIFVVYFSIYYLMPHFLFKNRLLEFVLFFSITLLSASLIQRITDNTLIVDNYFPHWTKVSIFKPFDLLGTLLKLNVVLAVPATIKILNYLENVQRSQQLLEKEKLEAELLLLKNQIHPHFLFNTLNSLYSLILKKSDRALDVILKLSDLLRYLLYETNSSQIELRKELDCVNNYLELEKIRYGNKVNIDLTVQGEIENKWIAPMLIIPFVENSFKHSTGGIYEQAQISIIIKIQDAGFFMRVKNSVPKNTELIKPDASGIGIANAQRRLTLIYGDNYDLKLTNIPDSFCVELQINLKQYGRNQMLNS